MFGILPFALNGVFGYGQLLFLDVRLQERVGEFRDRTDLSRGIGIDAGCPVVLLFSGGICPIVE